MKMFKTRRLRRTRFMMNRLNSQLGEIGESLPQAYELEKKLKAAEIPTLKNEISCMSVEEIIENAGYINHVKKGAF